jgi:predicted nuclease with RNAse H fold
MPVSLAQQIRCVERELRLRRHVYPRWIEEKRLSQADADAEILAMEAVLSTLGRLWTEQHPVQASLPLEKTDEEG